MLIRPTPTHCLYVSRLEWRAIMARTEHLLGERWPAGPFTEGKKRIQILIAVIREQLGITLPDVHFSIALVEEPPSPRFQALE